MSVNAPLRLRPGPQRFPPVLDDDARVGRRPVAWTNEPSAAITTFLVVLLTAFAAAIRLWNSAGQSLRLDEAFSVRWASWPLTPQFRDGALYQQSLFQATASDVHPPGYLLLLHFWMQAFGTGAATLRLPSEIAGTLAVPVLYLLASCLYGRVVGLFATLLGALSPLWIWHAQEVRMYPFLLLFTLLSAYGFVQALQFRRRWGWPLLFVASLLAIYTQYFAFLVLLAQALFLLAQHRNYTRRQILGWLGTMALLALAFLPWALVFLANHHGAKDPSLARPNLYTPLTIVIGFLVGYLTGPINSNILASWPLLVPLSLALSVYAARMDWRGYLLWSLFLTPIVVAFVVSLTLFPFISERYLMICTPAFYTLVAVAFSRLRQLVPRALVVALTTVLLVFSWRVAETNAANPNLENYRDPIAYIEAHAKPGDAIGLDSYYNEDAYLYYAHTNLPVYDLPLTPGQLASVKGGGLNKVLDRYLNEIEAGRRRLWVIYYLEANDDKANLVRHDLAYGTAGHTVIFGGPFQRDQSRYPKSYVSVQLVRYDLIQHASRSVYVRPGTMQQYRSLTHLSPTTRLPYASPFGSPGTSASVLGPILAMPRPAYTWHFSLARSVSAHSLLTIFNPSSRAIYVAVTVTKGGNTLHKRVHVPGSSDLEMSLSSWAVGERDVLLGLKSSSNFVPLLTSGGTKHALVTYGRRGSTMATTTATAARL